MRTLRTGLAAALIGSLFVGPLGAVGEKGFLSGDARAETKQPYTDFAVRARNVHDGTIAATTVLDANGNFLLEGLTTGKFIVELTRVGQNKVICAEGPFELKPGTAADQAFGKSNIGIACNRPLAAWWLVGAAAAAGITAGVVAAGPASASQ